jgi:2'-5' RNA ligase
MQSMPLSDRLFFAVYPDERARGEIAALARELRSAHGMQGATTMPQKLHVTMAMLGDFAGIPGNLLARASQVAEVATAMAPFDVSFEWVLTFGGRPRAPERRPLVLVGGEGVAGFHALHQALSLAMLKAGMPAASPNFIPHVTLLYDRHVVDEQAVAPVGWSVSELVLLHSRIGQNVPYVELGRWPLRGQ